MKKLKGLFTKVQIRNKHRITQETNVLTHEILKQLKDIHKELNGIHLLLIEPKGVLEQTKFSIKAAIDTYELKEYAREMRTMKEEYENKLKNNHK